MEVVSEIVEDWADLATQVQTRMGVLSQGYCYLVGAILVLARELRDYRRWAEEHHSS